MRHLARFTFAFTVLLLLAYYVPAGYWLVAESNQRAPAIHYSCVDGSLLFYRYQNESLKMTDEQGSELTREQFEQKLPLMHWAQLVKDGRMPESVGGVPISVEKIRRAQFSAKLKPEDLDGPGVPLHALLEAESGRVRLEMPEDIMRLSQQIEFLDPKTNRILSEKSALFAEAFRLAGFEFPVAAVGGNPTNRKPYDEGYYLSDAKGRIFRLRQVKGKPELLRLAGDLAKGPLAENWEGIQAAHFLVQESESKELRVLILDTQGKLHLALGPDYRRFTLPLQTFQPGKALLTLRGDLLNRTVIAESETVIEALVFDRNYKLIKSYTEHVPNRADLSAGKLARHLFPVTLRLEDSSSAFYRLYFDWGSPLAFVINGLLVGLVLLAARIKRLSLRHRLPDLAAVALGGFLGVAVIFALPRAD